MPTLANVRIYYICAIVCKFLEVHSYGCQGSDGHLHVMAHSYARFRLIFASFVPLFRWYFLFPPHFPTFMDNFDQEDNFCSISIIHIVGTKLPAISKNGAVSASGFSFLKPPKLNEKHVS